MLDKESIKLLGPTYSLSLDELGTMVLALFWVLVCWFTDGMANDLNLDDVDCLGVLRKRILSTW